MAGDPGGAPSLLFADHVEARQMGEYMRELRLPEPVALHSVRVLARGQRPGGSSTFEGRTFPDVRTMSLGVFAADRLSTSSTMPRLRPGDAAGSFVAPGERLVTDLIVVRGSFWKLSLALYGSRLPAGEAIPLPGTEQERAGVAPHLRPAAAREADRLDLADYEGAAGAGAPLPGDAPLPEATGAVPSEVDAAAVAAAAPTALPRALALGALPETNQRLGEHADWVSSLQDVPEVLEAEDIVKRLEVLIRDIGQLAQKMPDASSAHVSYGPVLARALLALTSRCMERLEFRPLHAALRALEAALVSAPTAAEVLKRGGLAHLLAVIREPEWAQMSSKVAALQALVQLCCHAIGMEALLGWASPMDALLPQKDGTGYELVLSLVLDGAKLDAGGAGGLAEFGGSRMEQIALALLRRAAFYLALSKLDAACTKLAADEPAAAQPLPLGDVAAPPEEALRAAVEALGEVADQFEQLSRSGLGPEPECGEAGALLGAECPRVGAGDALADSPPWLAASSGLRPAADDPFATEYPQMHGYLECYAAGRRLMPALCVLARRLPRLAPADRLAAFAPLRRLVCVVLTSVGGAQFFASDPQSLATLLCLLEAGGAGGSSGSPAGGASAGGRGSRAREAVPAVPRFPEALARSGLGAPELASLLELHVRASRLVMLLVAKTRQHGRNGLLPGSEGLPLLAALHQLCAQGSAGRDAVVCVFRSVFLIEWLLRQIEGRLEESAASGAGAAASASQAGPSLRHLVAILHAAMLGDPTASAAARYGGRALALCGRAAARLAPAGGEVTTGDGDGAGGGGAWGRQTGASLEFALDSEGPDGGLGRAVRLGRSSADVACLAQLRALSTQLRPWQTVEGQPAPPQGAEPVSTEKLLACIRLSGAPRALKRSMHEERGSRISLSLGGYTGVGHAGVEIPEVDYGVGSAENSGGGDHAAEPSDDRERFPPCDAAQLPLLAMRLLRRRAAAGAREALAIVLCGEAAAGAQRGAAAGGGGATAGAGSGAGGDARAARPDGLGALVPVLIRCAGALNLNLDALGLNLKDDGESIDDICATQRSHAELLEATLQTCWHLLRGLRRSGLTQYRNTELLHALLLVAERLGSGLVGIRPGFASADPEFRLLWRHCLVWVCRVFHAWVQCFPDAAGGQLLQPLIRHSRVLPWHFLPGLLLLSTCGSLELLLPKVSHSFSVTPAGKAEAPGADSLHSKSVLLPSGTRAGAPSCLMLSRGAGGGQNGESKGEKCRSRLFGQLWGTDAEAFDWEEIPDTTRGAIAVAGDDALVRALARRPSAAGVAMALSLVHRVNARKERLSMDDLCEAMALVTECSVTSDALLHIVTAAALDKLSAAGVPALGTVLSLGEAALNGSGSDAGESGEAVGMTDGAGGADPYDGTMGSSNALRDPRDARAVARILMVLARFGARSQRARRALAEYRAETLCLSVLAHTPVSSLPPPAITHAIRVLGLLFCSGPLGRTPEESKALAPSVPKFRMMSKSLSLLLNRTREDGPLAAPGAMAAALELLLRLNSTRSMCLNLLFSVSEDFGSGAVPVGHPVSVSVGCAFKLGACGKRLAWELAQADEHWNATPRGSESEVEAEEALGSWLHVGELLIQLCQTVLVNCPTASVFLAVALPGSAPPPSPEKLDEGTAKSVLADLQAVLARITGRTQRAETVPLRAAELVGNLRALQRQLIDTKPGPPPPTLTREELAVPTFIGGGLRYTSGATVSAVGGGRSAAGTGGDEDALAAVVSLFDAAAELEADPDWLSVAELDAAAPVAAGGARPMDFEFDGAAFRKKRKEAIEKADADRKAKRLKLAQRAERDERDKARRRAEDERRAAERAAKKGGAPPGAGAPPAAATSEKASSPPASAPAGGASPPAAAAGGKPAAAAAPTEAAGGVVPTAKAGGPSPVNALQNFVKDHPEFMRVLKNPTKLSDPRVKSMFMSELENYPEVKKFLAAKGLVSG